MPKKKSSEEMCIDRSQRKRFVNDVAKLAKGIHEDVCSTVEGIYNEDIDPKIDMAKDKKKKKVKDKDEFKMPDPAKFIHKHLTKKVNSFWDDLFG